MKIAHCHDVSRLRIAGDIWSTLLFVSTTLALAASGIVDNAIRGAAVRPPSRFSKDMQDPPKPAVKVS